MWGKAEKEQRGFLGVKLPLGEITACKFSSVFQLPAPCYQKSWALRKQQWKIPLHHYSISGMPGLVGSALPHRNPQANWKINSGSGGWVKVKTTEIKHFVFKDLHKQPSVTDTNSMGHTQVLLKPTSDLSEVLIASIYWCLNFTTQIFLRLWLVT